MFKDSACKFDVYKYLENQPKLVVFKNAGRYIFPKMVKIDSYVKNGSNFWNFKTSKQPGLQNQKAKFLESPKQTLRRKTPKLHIVNVKLRNLNRPCKN